MSVLVHVFDFDGTLFQSPTPSARLKEMIDDASEVSGKKTIFEQMAIPIPCGGLGWYQSLATLSPPAVPQQPDIDEWYVGSTVQRLRATAESAPNSRTKTFRFVLTGRDELYRSRLEELLRHAKLDALISQVFLKKNPIGRTVPHKLDVFFKLIEDYAPTELYYYEDRLEQGKRILYGMWRLFEDVLYYYPQAAPPERRKDKTYFPRMELKMLRANGVVEDCKPELGDPYWPNHVTNPSPPPPPSTSSSDPEKKWDDPLNPDPVVETWLSRKLERLPPRVFQRWRVPQKFVMVLVDPSLDKSQTMLSPESEMQIVEKLKEERRAYIANGGDKDNQQQRQPYR